MRIKLRINENSVVEVIPCDECEAIQGERLVTELELEYPETIKSYPIENYTKYIEFAENKDVGPCTKFFDEITDNVYKLTDPATKFKKIRIQFKFENVIDEPGNVLIWKSKIFELEFGEAINAEEAAEVQTQLLSLREIEEEWKNFVTTNCLIVVYKITDVPELNVNALSKTMFYLGPNTEDLTYGHYYRCVEIAGEYLWTDLTQDPNLADVANGIREINKNRTMQVWVGSKAELETAEKRDNVLYMPQVEDDDGVIRLGDFIIPQEKVLLGKQEERNEDAEIELDAGCEIAHGDMLEVSMLIESPIQSSSRQRSLVQTIIYHRDGCYFEYNSVDGGYSIRYTLALYYFKNTKKLKLHPTCSVDGVYRETCTYYTLNYLRKIIK